MLKCGSDGWTRMEKRWLFCTWCCTKRCAENCRGATHSIHCRVWFNDKFPEFRVFRNCGRSAKRNTTDGVVNVPVVMHWLFFTIKNWLSPSENFVKSQIACSVRIVLCELRLGWWSRSMSSHLHYLLFSFTFFFCNIFSEKSLFMSFFQCLLFKKTPLKKWEHNIFFLFIKKNSLFVLSTVETSSLDSHFLLIFQKKNLIAIFLPNVFFWKKINV